MPRLTEQEQQEIIRCLEADRPLPDKYRFLLFDDKREVELVWNGKTAEVTNVVLPFQTIEQIDEPRAETPVANAPGSGTSSSPSRKRQRPERPDDQPLLFDLDARGRQLKGWTNKLIWGDNKLVLSSLKNGPLRDEIEHQGGLKLIYIDPPFDVGADFSMDIEIGDETFTKNPGILEEIAYRDTWGRGTDSFITMIHERAVLMCDLLADDGSIFVHCDWRVSAPIRLVLDEIFGRSHFKNELVWHYTKLRVPTKQFPANHDSILFYAKGESPTFNKLREPKEKMKRQTVRKWDPDRKMAVQARDEEGNLMYYDQTDRSIDSVWNIQLVNPVADERLGYPTQKPEALVERMIQAASNEGDLVADFFCGSGTTAAVAERLGRKWIVSDLGKFAIHTTRKRMIGVQRQLKAEGKDYRAFEILNLGRYERQHYIGVNPNLREAEQQKQLAAKEADFLALILRAYRAETVENSPAFHGKKAGRMVVVGPVNLPVTRRFVEEVILECRKRHVTKVDVLGFEFEMGLFPNVLDEARDKGIDVAPKYIPAEVFDKRAVEKNQVVFHDVSFIEARPHIDGAKVAVELTDFSVFYSQDSIKNAEETLKNKASKVVVDRGQIVKVVKDKDGIVTREVLTKKWSDWIDYWSVDFNFESKREIIRKPIQLEDQGRLPGTESDQPTLVEYEEVWTGDYVFENEWQSFRTKKNRELEYTSPYHECEPGRRKIAVKVVDIFGNDTMTIADVTIPEPKKMKK